MTAPVVGFSADVEKGFGGAKSLVQVEPGEDVDQIEITVVNWPQVIVSSERSLIVSHDEARQIIAGLASVIT